MNRENKIKVILVSNTSWYLYNFRKSLIEHLVEIGYDVHIVAPIDKYSKRIVSMGAKFHNISISRHGKSFFTDTVLIYNLIKIYRKIKPNIIHHFTIKPIIYGSIASKFFKNILVVNAITGLGLAFNEKSISEKVLKIFVSFLYKFSISSNHKIIFQNSDNMKIFLDKKLVSKNQCYLIKSSGVDIDYFRPNGYLKSDSITRYGIMCRMLWSKGLKEFIQSAIKLNNSNTETEFYLLGSPDDSNPDNVPKSWLKEISGKYSFIHWNRHMDDVRQFLEKLDVFVLPSYYPEGVPKSLIEAGAMNLPLITTDSSGCRDVVSDGKNGYLVKAKDEKDLYEKMVLLSENVPLRVKMGKESRKIVKTKFNVNYINKCTMEVYN